jgi:hypothetical protein
MCCIRETKNSLGANVRADGVVAACVCLLFVIGRNFLRNGAILEQINPHCCDGFCWFIEIDRSRRPVDEFKWTGA